jgi:hypothetical protein
MKPTEPNQPITDREVSKLPVDIGRGRLLEEIMATPRSTRSLMTRSRRWLAPVAAAAAAAVTVAGGAWLATNGDDQPERDPGPGFAGSPSSSASATGPEYRNALMWGKYTLWCETRAQIKSFDADEYDLASGEAPAGCVVEKSQRPSGDPGQNRSPYQEPIKPMLLNSDEWVLVRAEGYDLTWRGPNGAQLHIVWVTGYGDPWSYDRYVGEKTETQLLGERTMLTSFGDGGQQYEIAMTSYVRQQTGVVFEGTGMTHDEFLDAIATAEWVTPEEYEAVVRPVAEG